MIAQDNQDSWPKYIAWTALAAFCTAIATKAGEAVVEKIKEKQAPK